MSGIEFYVLDTETTGLSVDYHEIIEISVIRVRDRLQISRQVKADNPKTASFDALKITNKTMDDLLIGVSKLQAISEVNDFFALDGLTSAHRCIIGHNIVGFDKKFLHAMWSKHNYVFPADMWCDTMSIMRKFVKDNYNKENKPKINLHASCDLMGIKKIAEAHNAKDDSRNNFLLWKKMLELNLDYLSFIKRFPHLSEDGNDLE